MGSPSSPNSSTRTSTVARKTTVRDAQRICVSALENVVVMHDPKALEDMHTVARDTSNVVQLLTYRANGAGSRKTAGGSRKPANRLLTPTTTANYYECDQCLTSMDEAARLKMPIVRASDFLQPPPYGSQEDVYRSTAQHAVRAAVEGINSCVFAYGQTGSGKTYTLFGDTANIQRDPGVVPRTLDDLFSQLEATKASYAGNPETDYSYNVQLAFFELYQNDVYCLLSRRGPLHVQFSRNLGGSKETMVINDLQQQTVTSAANAYPLVEMGLRRRQTSETAMNARSSRSHAILQVRVSQWRTTRETRESVQLNSTINLVDLAGSERQKTASTAGKNREEGIQINQSLATLARVINDISRGAKFVNYRDSLLTMVLKDNLGGNSRTFMIATVSPIAFSYQESCATLSYARDVRKIRNCPTVNKTFQTRANLLEQNARLKHENESLKEQMEAWMHRLQAEERQVEVPGVAPPIASTSNGANSSPAVTKWWTTPAAAEVPGGARMPRVPYEAFVAATSCGLTAPLLLSSHRKYRSVTGIGGACVEGGVVRVTSLVRETMAFDVAQLLDEHGSRPSSECDKANSAEPEARGSGEAAAEVEPRRLSFSSLSATPHLGQLELERVAQRSCEQHYWARFNPPQNEAAMSCIVDVQINGQSLGSARRELHHGDVLCLYLEDYHDGGGEQHLLSFHFVDLNCLSRGSASLNTATIGQLSVSVDLPSGENLTLEDIQQLQRDNAKLLDMVRQQEQAIEYQCQRGGNSRGRSWEHSRLSSMTRSPDGTSPNPEYLDNKQSPSVDSQVEGAHPIRVETFRRSSFSPAIRATSSLPADVEAGSLLERARQSLSQQRLDSAVRENEQLHKVAVTRNATLEALAKRLADLEAGEEVSPRPTHTNRVSFADPHHDKAEDSEEEGEEEEQEEEESSQSVRSRTQSTAHAPPLDRRSESREISRTPRSITCISSLSDSSAEDSGRYGEQSRTEEVSESHVEAVKSDGAANAAPMTTEEKAEKAKMRIFFENADGNRERYQAALRERELFNRIAELEQLLDEQREELSLLESRLRISKDDTMEQTMLRAEAEKDKASLMEDLASLRAENAALLHDNATLDANVQRSEAALAANVAQSDEELERRASVMADQIKALKELARLWKRRTMKYIALGYGAGGDNGICVDEVPWEQLRTDETAAVVKRRLAGWKSSDPCSAVMARTVDDFENSTAAETVKALECALAELDRENARLQEEIRRCEEALSKYKDLVERLRREKQQLEQDMANTSANEEEAQQMRDTLENTSKQLADAESDLTKMQQRLAEAVRLSKNNSQKSSKSNELLLAEQRQIIDELQKQVKQLEDGLFSKDEELRTILQHLDGEQLVDSDGPVQVDELRNRIEDMIAQELPKYEPATGYSAFPANFQFSDEMTALIRVCLRVLLDRLKVDLYVMNKQNMHKFALLVPAVQLRPEAQFHTFIHELRGVVVEMAGRAQRIGGKWSVSEPGVLSNLVDHRRRRAGNALNGLLIWYDHWDLSPKAEHVCYMELIRNSDRILQMARLVRQESLINTNATSTLSLPIPGKKGASDTAASSKSGERKDSTIRESCKILKRMNSDSRSSHLASAMAQSFVTPTKSPQKPPVESPFLRSTTATVLPLSRSATAVRLPPRTSNQPDTSPAAFARAASSHILPVSENDVNYVANSDVAHVESLSAYKFSRRKSSAAMPELAEGGGKFMRQASAFSRCQTAMPAFTTPAKPSAASAAPQAEAKPAAKLARTKSVQSKLGAPLTYSHTTATPLTNPSRRRSQDIGRVAKASPSTTATAPRATVVSKKSMNATTSPAPVPSFYNASVIKSLRERSGSESNQASRGSLQKRKAKAPLPFQPTRTRVVPRLSTTSGMSSGRPSSLTSGGENDEKGLLHHTKARTKK